ncbi:unnamed protein product [Brassica oleracea]
MDRGYDWLLHSGGRRRRTEPDDLSRNYLNGSIPPEWGTLQLINLIVSSNYLTGDIPSTFSKPTALADLCISNNSLPELYQISSRTGQNLQNSLYDLHIN